MTVHSRLLAQTHLCRYGCQSAAGNHSDKSSSILRCSCDRNDHRAGLHHSGHYTHLHLKRWREEEDEVTNREMRGRIECLSWPKQRFYSVIQACLSWHKQHLFRDIRACLYQVSLRRKSLQLAEGHRNTVIFKKQLNPSWNCAAFLQIQMFW